MRLIQKVMKYLLATCFLVLLLIFVRSDHIEQQHDQNNTRLLQTSFTQSLFLNTNNQFTNKFAKMTQQLDKHKQWRSQILNGIATLPRLGSPGQSVVFGSNTAVIMIGDTSRDVLISAAELGKGRVIVITHSAYLANFTSTNTDANVAKLHTNIKKWITRNKFTANTDLTTSQLYARSTSTQAFLGLYSTEDLTGLTEQQKTKILTYVKNGGGLVVAICPWGWAQIRGTNDFTKLLNYKTMLEAGIVLNEQIIWNSATFSSSKPNLDQSHLAIQLNIALSPQKPGFNYTTTRQIVSQVKYIPESQKAKLRKLVLTSIPRSQILINTPTATTPVTSNYVKCRLIFYQYIVLQSGLPGIVAPGYDKFPGQADLSNPNFRYQQNVPFTFTPPGYKEYHHTGFYAIAGQTVTFNVVGTVPTTPWEILIGFHYDDDKDHTSWVRWPTVYVTGLLNAASVKVTSPYGGLVILRNPSSSTTALQITLSNVVEAPFYDSQNPASVADWTRRRTAPAPWGCAVGRYAGICFPRSAFVNLADPIQVMNLYDQIALAYYTLRGSDPSKQQKQYAVSDIDPVIGYMHSGFPLVTKLDVADPTNSGFLFNYANIIANGNWGYFHEMGHNVQRTWWTFPGTVEVTCNIFSLKGMEISTGVRPKYAPWFVNQKSKFAGYLANPVFTTWQADAGIALAIYVQVIEDYGWNTLQRVFTSYETGNSSTYPTDTQGRIDLFWSKYSIEAGENLSPLLTKWGIPFTSTFISAVSALPNYVQKVNIMV